MLDKFAEFLGMAEPGEWPMDKFKIDSIWLRARDERQKLREQENQKWQEERANVKVP